MEDSPIGLDKWLPVLWLIANCRNGIHHGRFTAIWELRKRRHGSCFIVSGWRCRMTVGRKLSGEVEIDETYIGGKARNMHKSVKARKLKGDAAASRKDRSSGNT